MKLRSTECTQHKSHAGTASVETIGHDLIWCVGESSATVSFAMSLYSSLITPPHTHTYKLDSVVTVIPRFADAADRLSTSDHRR